MEHYTIKRIKRATFNLFNTKWIGNFQSKMFISVHWEMVLVEIRFQLLSIWIILIESADSNV